MQKRAVIKFLFIFILLNTLFINKIWVQSYKNETNDFGNNSPQNNKKSISLSFDNPSITFNFIGYSDFANGIGGKNSEYEINGHIKSSQDWILSFVSIEPFLHENGISTIPLDNVGITADSRDNSRTNNFAENDPIALSISPKVIMQSRTRDERGNSNPNYFFSIYLEMGTQKGEMNQNSLLEQNLPKGEYRTTIEFVVREDI